ncbi:MAG: hypothetical protein ACRD4O_13000 [Bryobacteraceae bacterium]
MSDFKLRGLNPLVHRVVTSGTASFYLSGAASEYPTAWLDIDGNERAAVQFRNSDLNKYSNPTAAACEAGFAGRGSRGSGRMPSRDNRPPPHSVEGQSRCARYRNDGAGTGNRSPYADR